MRRGLVLIALALACLALSPLARAAVVGPPRNANTADGFDALRSLTTGDTDTAVGAFVMQFNTEGFFNTAIGGLALNYNTTGNANTAVGVHALINNIDGSENVAVGLNALRDNTTGDDNTAVGRAALRSKIQPLAMELPTKLLPAAAMFVLAAKPAPVSPWAITLLQSANSCLVSPVLLARWITAAISATSSGNLQILPRLQQ